MHIPSIIQPKTPSSPEWQRLRQSPQMPRTNYPLTVWGHPARGLLVFSAVEVATTEPGAEALGPEYHLSISRRDKRGQAIRCSSADARWVLAQFDLEDAEEDNHVPHGIARHFWRPVADHLSGYQCPCKETEPAIVEDRGDYVWRGITR